MPLHNLNQKHITDEDKVAIDNAINAFALSVKDYLINLTPEERQRYGSIAEKNKLLVNKVLDYQLTQPELSTPDVDWDEFKADHSDRSFLETRINRILSIAGQMENAKIMHDYDNYQNALTDYSYTQYKADTVAGGYEVKRGELRQFFPNTGGGSKSSSDGGTTTPQP